MFIKRIILICSCIIALNNLYSQKVKKAAFTHFFPDTSLAKNVADKLGKKITDDVSIVELNSIKGEFSCGPGETKNLTGIGYLTGISSFSCCKNEVTELPLEIGKLINLESLDLGKAFELKTIPHTIGNLKKLRYIRICGTQVETLPPEIGLLQNLDTLWAFDNNLVSLPKEIGNLKRLSVLNVCVNQLKRLPDEICNLASLKVLILSNNKIDRLPENIGALNNLRTLNLFSNNLKSLPESISQLENLRYFNVYDNFGLSSKYKKMLPDKALVRGF